MACRAYTVDDFKGILKKDKDKLVAVNFYDTSCSRKFEEASNNSKYKNVTFVTVDVKNADNIASACGVKSKTEFQFYKKEKMIDHFEGEKPEVLVQKLDKYKT